VNYSLHPLAERDLRDAAAFYRDQAGQQASDRLFDEFERIIRLLFLYPGIGTPISRDQRTFPLRVFPYTVVYRPTKPGIRVFAVRHQRRKPGYGGGRR